MGNFFKIPLADFIVTSIVSLPEGNSYFYRSSVNFGDTSYACYLTHFFILKAVRVLIPVSSFISAVGVSVFAFALVIIVSLARHEFFEKPAMRILKHQFGS